MAKCICSREVFEGETKFFKWFNYGISRNVEKGEYNFGMPLLEVIAAVLSVTECPCCIDSQPGPAQMRMVDVTNHHPECFVFPVPVW